MAQYWTDFSEKNNGDLKAQGWTERWREYTYTVVEDAGSTGGKHVQMRPSGSAGTSLLSWDLIDADADRDDVEVLMKYRPLTSGGHNANVVYARGRNAYATRECYMGNHLISNPVVAAERFVSGSYSLISSVAAPSTRDVWYWIRFRVNGTTLQVRIWADGDAEPGTWAITETDANVAGVGWVGFGSYGANIAEIDIDVFAVGTDGDVAPVENPFPKQHIYWTDFEEYTTGQAPAGWTERYADTDYDVIVETDVGSIGGKRLKFNPTATAANRAYALTPDALTDLPEDEKRDVEVLMLLEVEPNSVNGVYSIFRGYGDVFSGAGRYLILSALWPGGGTSQDFGIDSYVDGTYNTYGSVSNFTPAPVENTRYWFRSRLEGTTVYQKFWEEGTAEPSEWQNDAVVDEATLVNGGWIGIGAFQPTQSGNAFYVEVFSVATSGGTAPLTKPTLYWTDFSEYTTAQQPSDWTKRWQTAMDFLVQEVAGTSGGKVLRSFSAGTNSHALQYGLTWDAINDDPNRGNADVLMRLRFKTSTGAQNWFPLIRAAGADHASRSSFGGTLHEQGNLVLIEKWVNGTYSAVTDTTAFTINEEQWYWVRFRVNGDSLQQRIWADGDAEPVTWIREATDATIPDAGWIGVGTYERNNDVEVDIFSVATGGATAPMIEPEESIVPQTYATDFSEYTTDQAPSDWTKRWQDMDFIVRAEAAALGGKVLKSEPNANSVDGTIHAISWDAIDADTLRADVDILMRFRYTLGSGQQSAWAMGRGQGTLFAEKEAYGSSHYQNLSYEIIGEWIGGAAWNPIVTETGITQALNTWYYKRFRINGNTLKSKLWEAGTAEPGAWTIETTDNDISAAGWAGLGVDEDPAGLEVDYFAVSTGGDIAPLPSVEPIDGQSNMNDNPESLIIEAGISISIQAALDDNPDESSSESGLIVGGSSNLEENFESLLTSMGISLSGVINLNDEEGSVNLGGAVLLSSTFSGEDTPEGLDAINQVLLSSQAVFLDMPENVNLTGTFEDLVFASAQLLDNPESMVGSGAVLIQAQLSLNDNSSSIQFDGNLLLSLAGEIQDNPELLQTVCSVVLSAAVQLQDSPEGLLAQEFRLNERVKIYLEGVRVGNTIRITGSKIDNKLSL